MPSEAMLCGGARRRGIVGTASLLVLGMLAIAMPMYASSSGFQTIGTISGRSLPVAIAFVASIFLVFRCQADASTPQSARARKVAWVFLILLVGALVAVESLSFVRLMRDPELVSRPPMPDALFAEWVIQASCIILLTGILTGQTQGGETPGEKGDPGRIRVVLSLIALSTVMWRLSGAFAPTTGCGGSWLGSLPWAFLLVLLAVRFGGSRIYVPVGAATAQASLLLTNLCIRALLQHDMGQHAHESSSPLIALCLLSGAIVLELLCVGVLRRYGCWAGAGMTISMKVASSRGEGETGLEAMVARFSDVIASLYPKASLTPREAEVVSLTLVGKTSTQIAERLSIRPSSVSTYRSRAYRKLHVESKGELAERVSATLASKPERNGQEERPAPQWKWTPQVTRLGGVLLRSALVSGCLAGLKLLPPTFILEGLATASWVAAFALGLILCIRHIARAMPADHWSQAGGLVAYATSGLALSLSLVDFVSQELAAVSLVAVALAATALLACLSAWPERESPKTPALLIGFGLPGVVVSPLGGAVAFRGVSPDYLILCSMVLSVIAGVTTWIGQRWERHETAAVGIEGAGRTLAYLKGRGLNDLQAQVAYQTALGITPTRIANALNISVLTVSSYKSLSYKALQVHGIAKLRQLLREEAGLNV
ncbi:LuxR C-terminal-related transcriptional regulator [Olsenella sp. HMSC062G07]|uniref:LuxR C-terminal-related transcriptional regulator n=1 Tax=Olsenella sp. HMSC062G07 TaxID=1739330 RepID=UPI0008A511D6|nr:LuxR C-terminal-related transcriptional regulator [Olsenella sp. HMSC062G07]OFK24919.1 hypothetical protein HMPREF2826_05780 [Olsenella sp. HMSC062G07]